MPGLALTSHLRSQYSREYLPPVVFCINDDFALPLAISWQSLCDSNEQLVSDLQIVVLHTGLSGKTQHYLRWHADRLNINLAIVPVALPNLPYNLHFGGTHANYIRLTIPTIFGNSGKIVYFDADLIFESDILPLLETKLAGQPLAAVRDQGFPTYGVGKLEDWIDLGIPEDREYFNSGVLLIDLAASEHAKLFDLALQCVFDHSDKLRMWDQDALNFAANDNWLRLERKWNMLPYSALVRTPWVRYRGESILPLEHLLDEESEASILHYATPSKPWRNLLPDGPAKRRYHHYWRRLIAAEKGTQLEGSRVYR